MKESYLVTGGTGFVGANLVRALVKKNKKVSIITRSNKINWRFKDIAKNLDIYEADLLSPALEKIISKISPSHVFHLAAYGSLPKEDNIEELIAINIKGTIRLLTFVKNHPLKIFVNTSSSSEYGVKVKPMKETDTLLPVNNYGISKVAATLFATNEAKKYNIPLITFRLFSVYGYYEEATRLVPWVINKALRNKQLDVTSPKHVRDFIFIDDVVQAYLHAATRKFTAGEICNIGTGQQSTVGDIVTFVMKMTKSTAHINWGGYAAQDRQVEKGMWRADMTHTKKVLNWEPSNSLETGLKKTIRWMEKNKKFYD